METFEINYSNDNEPIKINYLDGTSKDKLIIIVGGCGDDKDKLLGVVNYIVKKGANDPIVTFPFRGFETGNYRPLVDQVSDLKEVVTHFMQINRNLKVTIINTSDGAVSSTHLLSDQELGFCFRKAIYLDPADYYQDDIKRLDEDLFLWSGTVNTNQQDQLFLT